MAISPFDKDVEIIQKLDDEPNDVQGLTPAELKKRFDQAAVWLKEYINSILIPAIAGDGVSGGAANIGASVDDFSGSTVQDVLDAFNDALVARYTKSETNSYVSQETSDLVASVNVNLNTGVITVTKKDGTQNTFDTALEKVPASMALVEEADGAYLVITNQDGSQTRTNVSNLIDTYTFNNSTEISFSVTGAENNRAVTASIRDSSIGMNKFTLEVTQALEQYNATSAENAKSAEDSADAAAESASEALNSRNSAAESASTANTKAGEAVQSALSASQSASSAASSAQSAQSNASQALSARNAAQEAQKSIENMQVSANTLPAGTDATVSKTVEDGTVKLNFGIPQGADGGAIAADGLWGVEVDENGDLILTYTGDEVPPLSINEDGDLVYTLDGSEVNLGHVVGRDSQTPNITIGQVETLPAGSPVTASITGQTPNLVLNLGIPQGQQGDHGAGVPSTEGVPDNYVLTPIGWVPPPSGGSSDVGDLELVASATLEEAVDVISLDLEKPCTEVIAVLTPYGDDSNQDTKTIPYMYAGDGASVELKGFTLGTMKLKSNSAMVYDFRAARFLISGNLVEKTMYEETGAAPTGITPPDSQPWYFKSRNWEIVSINALQNIRLQLWGYVWGVGTKLDVYGR